MARKLRATTFWVRFGMLIIKLHITWSERNDAWYGGVSAKEELGKNIKVEYWGIADKEHILFFGGGTATLRNVMFWF